MSKKILFTASTQSHLDHFHRPYIKYFEDMGYSVTTLALPVNKSFFSVQNLQAVLSTRKLLATEQYDIISSHATLAGIVTRLAIILMGRAKKSIRVFHTSHGYLFHDDGGFKKWAYLLPEKICGMVTDVLMVMNHEDLEIAKKHKLGGRKNRIYYINGMGLDPDRFRPTTATREQKEAFGLEPDDFAFLYAGEFSKRKNHALLLKAFASAQHRLQNSKLVLAGDGILFHDIKELAKDLKIDDRVIFLGYCANIQELYPCCQVSVSTSRIEGLPFNIMEAMASGLPVVASNIKGHQELVVHMENGLLFESDNEADLAQQLTEIYERADLRNQFRSSSLERIKQFSIAEVLPEIIEIYKDNLGH